MIPAALGIDVGIRNLSFCVLQKSKEGQFCIVDWQLIDVLQLCGLDGSCDDLTSNEIHDIARHALPLIFPTNFIQRYQIAHVGIEQQPHGKYGNQKIILFSHLLFEYFRSSLLNQHRGDTLQTVAFTGAAKKYDKQWLAMFKLSKPTTYIERKQTSVRLCKLFCAKFQLSELPKATLAKQDDLADAFLLAYIAWSHWLDC